MRCDVCRGACCEEVILPRVMFLAPTEDIRRWWEYRGELVSHELIEGIELPEAGIRLELPCTKLEDGGRCSIYEDRPDVCRDYAPGGRHCLETVARRRSMTEYQLIRDDEDPEELDAG
jgi:Fe-S-cluster containining protein